VSVTVRTQAELDQALAEGRPRIVIDSPAGMWLTLDGEGSARVEAGGSARVVARQSAHVEAGGSARVVAWESAHVEARGSAHVKARGSAHVVARQSAHVEAGGSAHVEARGSAHVEAWGSAHVVAWGSAHVEAWESAHVEAGTHVAVHLHSRRVYLTGGVVIDMTDLDQTDPRTWCDVNRVPVDSDGTVTLYKALGADLVAGHGFRPTQYMLGSTVTAKDWRDDHNCGGGLHLSPSPSCARRYLPDATRYVAVRVALADLRPIPGGAPKAKVRQCLVVREVDLYGQPWTRAGTQGESDG